MSESAQEKEQELSEAEAIAIIAGALALGATAQATATSLSPLIGVPVPSLLPILILAMSRPVNFGIATLPSATASSESSRLEATYRAHYVYAASRRLAGLTGEKRQKALQAERRYFNQHMEASANRKESASAVDKASQRYGNELGWYAKMDSITSAECRAAHGKNFSVTRIPAIGWPGSVHPNCRCRAGKKHATSQTVYGVQPDRKEVA